MQITDVHRMLWHEFQYSEKIVHDLLAIRNRKLIVHVSAHVHDIFAHIVVAYRCERTELETLQQEIFQTQLNLH